MGRALYEGGGLGVPLEGTTMGGCATAEMLLYTYYQDRAFFVVLLLMVAALWSTWSAVINLTSRAGELRCNLSLKM